MSNDFIPSADDPFSHYINAFLTFATENPGLLALTPAQVTAFTPFVTAWNTDFGDYNAAKAALDGLRVAKDRARAALETPFRALVAAIQLDANVTDATRAAAGLPVHKTTRTPTGEIETHPVLYKVDVEHLLHRLWFSDSATPGSKAKPEDALYCEIRELLVVTGGPVPVDPEAMPFLASDSKAPYRNDFTAADLGKTAYYCQRWVNKVQQPGPWGMITGYVVG